MKRGNYSMPTNLEQSMYRRGTMRAIDASASIPRAEYDACLPGPLILAGHPIEFLPHPHESTPFQWLSFDPNAILEELKDAESNSEEASTAELHAFPVFVAESHSRYIGDSSIGPRLLPTIGVSGPDRAPTPSQTVDEVYRVLFQHCAAILGTTHAPPRDNEAAWRGANSRRLNLIDKDMEHGLSEEERLELEQLEMEVQVYLDRVAPISFEFIERLERSAASEGLSVNRD
jgi:hypothetical protein